MSYTEVRVPGGPQAPARARQELHAQLGGQIPGRLLEDAGLLVSELVTNSVLHGGAGPETTVGLRVRLQRERVRIEVSDPGGGFLGPVAPEPGRAEDHGGYGLFLVTQLADAWGVAESDDTRVWFELRR